MLDGTPVLDIKPYVAYTDAHPGAGQGWLEDETQPPGASTTPADPVLNYAVHFDAKAAEQAAWIESHTSLPLRSRIQSTLELGPAPHPYRRIRPLDVDWMQLAVKEWRVRFNVVQRDVRVVEIYSGFRASQLASNSVDEPLQKHRDFHAHWPRDPAT
jgi:hypothetical protein